jgi:transposase
LPQHLPRIDVLHDQIRVIRNIRIKYGCRACETGVTTATMPVQLIPKSMATSGLLAYVAVSKYADALPLHVQEQIFTRIGVDISRATLAFWMIQVGKALGPIIALLEQALLSGDVIHMDETPIQVLNEPDKRATSQSYMWVRMGGMTADPIVLFDYDPSRSSAVPLRLLDGFGVI